MLHAKFRGNRPTCSGVEEFVLKDFGSHFGKVTNIILINNNKFFLLINTFFLVPKTYIQYLGKMN